MAAAGRDEKQMYPQVSKLIRVKKVSKWELVGGARRTAETRVTIRESLTICYVIRLQSPRSTCPASSVLCVGGNT